MVGMAHPGDVGDVNGQRAHPFDVGADMQRADDLAEIACDRLLQRQQLDRGALGVSPLVRDVVMVGDDLFCEFEIGLQEGVRRVLHRVGGQSTHIGQLGAEIRQLFLVCRAHGPGNTPYPGL